MHQRAGRTQQHAAPEFDGGSGMRHIHVFVHCMTSRAAAAGQALLSALAVQALLSNPPRKTATPRLQARLCSANQNSAPGPQARLCRSGSRRQDDITPGRVEEGHACLGLCWCRGALLPLIPPLNRSDRHSGASPPRCQ